MTAVATIECKYSCSLCGIVRTPCKVRMRLAAETLDEWMMVLKATLSEDHRRRSPTCHPETLSEVLIPSSPHDQIGVVSS